MLVNLIYLFTYYDFVMLLVDMLSGFDFTTLSGLYRHVYAN